MRLILFFIIALILVEPFYAQKSKDDLAKELKNRFSKLSSVELNFEMKGGGQFRGIIRAKKGNKYYVKMPVMTIVSNGKTVWNYNDADKKVLISAFDKNAAGAFSLDRFFFSFLEEFEPVQLTKENLSNAPNCYVLTFESKKGQSGNPMDMFKLWLTRSKLDIVRIEITANGNTQAFNIKNIKLNPKISDKFFDFKPAKGVEVINLK